MSVLEYDMVAYSEGDNAFCKSLPVTANPYNPTENWIRFWSWIKGWYEITEAERDLDY